MAKEYYFDILFTRYRFFVVQVKELEESKYIIDYMVPDIKLGPVEEFSTLEKALDRAKTIIFSCLVHNQKFDYNRKLDSLSPTDSDWFFRSLVEFTPHYLND